MQLNIDILKALIKKEKFIILFSIALGVILSCLFVSVTKGYSYKIQDSISDELIRFHVLANSDSNQDQILKINVKNEIINMISKELDESTSKAETKKFILHNLNNIKDKALEIVKLYGYNYDISVEIGNSYFPSKTYGDITLPAGEYEALIIKIGEAKGKNWWCVMFPPLCFVDVSVKEVPEKDKKLLKEVLTEDEYKLISEYKDNEKIGVKLKFKIVELWQKLKQEI